VEIQARSREGRPADFDYVGASGDKVPLSTEMVVVLDEGKSIAQAADEVWIGTEHALGAMSQVGVSTSGLLQRYGITPTAMSGILTDQVQARRMTTQDWVALARQGQLTPVYYRQSLLRDLVSLISLAEDRHVILVGPAGVGKRTLVYSLALLIAEARGRQGLYPSSRFRNGRYWITRRRPFRPGCARPRAVRCSSRTCSDSWRIQGRVCTG